MSKRWVRPVLLVLVPCLAVVAAVGVWLWGGRYVTTENAYVKADIARVAAQITGRIEDVMVKDHALVKKGTPLIKLDQEPFRIKLAAAEADVDAARTEVRTMIASWKEAKSELQQAKGLVNYWQAQLKRSTGLEKRRIVSSSKLEEVANSAREAVDKVAVMKSKVARMLSQVGDAERPVDNHPMVREKIAIRDTAARDLRNTVIRAPVDGTAVNVKLQPGEYVEPDKPLFALVVASQPWIEANFKETELTHVRPGMKATVVLDIYPDVEWTAEVGSISPATGAEFALLPPQNASGNWVKVVQRLPVRIMLKPRAGEPPLRAGMTAAVSVDTKRQRKLSSLFSIFSTAIAGKEDLATKAAVAEK
ncbi:MAG: HlyD family secretion protein [Hyphomicrobiaceae bacterium]